jgi:UDP-2,3-diacylglucosamine hydrolase
MAAPLPVMVPRAPAGGVLTLADPVFVSDLHLSAAQPRTQARFLRFLREEAADRAELVILGDLFEYWLGDDVVDAADGAVIAALRQHVEHGHPLYLMHGNRDLLLGARFAAATASTLLPDPTLAQVVERKLLLTHGDAWCTQDARYQRLRSALRRPWVQRLFLTLPAAARRSLVARARAASESSKRNKPAAIMDVTPAAVEQAFSAVAVDLMIHGHTHRPAVHTHAFDARRGERWVLPDWDHDTAPLRGGYLCFAGSQPQLVTLAP